MDTSAIDAMQTATEAVEKASDATMSLSEKGLISAEIVLTGFVVIFVVLIMLIVLIMIYGGIVSGAQKAAQKKKEKTEMMAEITASVVNEPVSVPVNQSGGVPEEIVAVISAAVASMYGSGEKVKIKSIKKSNGGRSAWANAGVLNNTRPF